MLLKVFSLLQFFRQSTVKPVIRKNTGLPVNKIFDKSDIRVFKAQICERRPNTFRFIYLFFPKFTYPSPQRIGGTSREHFTIPKRLSTNTQIIKIETGPEPHTRRISKISRRVPESKGFLQTSPRAP